MKGGPRSEENGSLLGNSIFGGYFTLESEFRRGSLHVVPIACVP